ncbi:MAG: DUF5105 domain-containing protein [Candidatus Aenigmatarchaeota archaeon]
MKKKNSLMILYVLLILLLLTACNSGPSPKDVVNEYLNALKEGNFQKASQYVEEVGKDFISDKINKNQDDEKFGKLILSKISYEIGNVKINKNEAWVETKITSIDMPTLVAKTMSQLLPLAFASAFGGNEDQQQMDNLANQYIENNINSPDAPKTTTQVNIHLIKTKDGWKIAKDNSDNLANAVTGNLLKAFPNQK